MGFDHIRLQEQTAENGRKFAVVTMNRPQSMNALNAQVLGELDQAVNRIAEDSSLRAVILTGEGKAFVAGADIAEFQNLSPSQALEMSERGQKLFQKIEDLEVPTIAAVNGFALGGGLELALCCDILVASSKAKWGLPEVSLGLLPGYGGTQRLALKTNFGIAKRATLTGEMFTAEQGEKWGLFSQVCEPESLMNEVQTLASMICERAPIAVRMAKACVSVGFEEFTKKGYPLEARAFSETFKTADQKEGVQAFLSKKKPDFKGE